MQIVSTSKRRLGILRQPRTLALTRQAIVCAVITAMLSLVVHGGGMPGKSSALAEGLVTVTGTVKVNGQGAITGQTLFASNRIVTAGNSTASITLRNSSRLNLSADSDLNVESSSKTLSGSLTDGLVSGSVPAGVLVEFKTTDVTIVSDAAEPIVFSLQTNECAGTNITVDKGRIDARIHGQLRTIKAGESLSTTLGTPAPQTTQQSSSHKKKLGIFIGIGSAVAVLLAVVLGKNDDDQEAPGGGCVIAPSGFGGPGQCP
jgi:hypothetical protein